MNLILIRIMTFFYLSNTTSTLLGRRLCPRVQWNAQNDDEESEGEVLFFIILELVFYVKEADV